VSYRRSCSPSIYGLSTKHAGHKLKGTMRICNLQSKLRKRGGKIDYISTVCLMASRTISIHAEQRQISDAPRKQNNSI